MRRTFTSRAGYEGATLLRLVRYIASGFIVGVGANCKVEEKDLVIIGGGVAGYVAAIKAGQSGLKVHYHSYHISTEKN